MLGNTILATVWTKGKYRGEAGNQLDQCTNWEQRRQWLRSVLAAEWEEVIELCVHIISYFYIYSYMYMWTDYDYFLKEKVLIYMKYSDLYFWINYNAIKCNELKNYAEDNFSLMTQKTLWNPVMP